MTLTTVGKLLPGVTFTEPELVIHEDCCITATRCGFWVDEDPTQTGTIVMIYRSSLMKDTNPLYAPVAELLLGAEEVDVLYEISRYDPDVVSEIGRMTIYGLHAKDFRGLYTLSEVQEIFANNILCDEREVA